MGSQVGFPKSGDSVINRVAAIPAVIVLRHSVITDMVEGSTLYEYHFWFHEATAMSGLTLANGKGNGVQRWNEEMGIFNDFVRC
jgi:hypothetical protein